MNFAPVSFPPIKLATPTFSAKPRPDEPPWPRGSASVRSGRRMVELPCCN